MQRRSLIKNLGGLLVAPALPFGSFTAGHKKPALRVAHITDVHLKDKWDAPARFRRCLQHIHQQSPRVDMLLNGGDIVFDMNKENLDTIGAQKAQAIYGKKYSMDQLGLTIPYYSFTQSGWKFIVLDSCHLDIDGTWYIGKLGDEQFAWLDNELKTTLPVCVLSHIPILTATNLVEDNIVNKWEMTGGDMHTDTAKIIDLFYAHPNVRLCLSGHIHLREKLVYNNVTYICDGAVSGAWWEGNKRQTAPGYGLIDLYTDGSFDEAYINY
jgi:Icc protein